jgi:hypothetical protein
MTVSWHKEELAATDFGDKRLNERLEIVLKALAERPNASIPEAVGGRNELEAAYRFCDNNACSCKISTPNIPKSFHSKE